MKPRIGLTYKVTGIFVLFAALLLVIVGSLAYNSGHTAFQKATIADLFSAAAEKETALDRWLERPYAAVVSLAAMPNIADDLAQLATARMGSAAARAAHDHLVSELRPFTGKKILSLFVMAPETGKVIASTNPDEEETFKEDRPYFINGKNGPSVHGPYNSIHLRVPAITIAAPVKSSAGRLLGVLAGRLDLDDMSAVINRNTGPYKTEDSYLVNRSSLFVTQPRFILDRAVLRLGIHTEAVERGLRGESGHILTTDYRGVPTITVYRWLPTHKLCLVIERDQQEAFAPSQAFGKIMIVISFFALLFASLVAVGLARTITRPIMTLRVGAARFGRGETDVRLPEAVGDELGDLARDFNRMAKAISEREMALRESEERYRNLFTRAGDGIFLLSGNGELIEVNESLARMHGYSVQEMLHMNLKDLDTPGTFQRAPERIRRLWAGEALTFEVEHYHKDGHVFPLEVSASLISSCGESYVQCFHRDITERKQVEETLRESKKLDEMLLSALPHPTMLIRGRDKVVLAANKIALASGVKIGGHCWRDFGKAEYIRQSDKDIIEKYPGNVPAELGIKCIFCQGDECISEAQGQRNLVIEAFGKLWDTYWVKVKDDIYLHYAIDITDRKRAEEEKRSLEERLQRAERMEALGTLAGGVAHDLNNVLGVLSGYSELMIEKIPAGNPLREYAANILRSSEKGAAIIQDLLTLARRGVVVSTVVDINSIVSNFLATPEFDRLKDYHPQVNFKTDRETDLLHIKGSPVHLEKTVMNLVSNAAEAIVGRGEVKIRTENRYLDKAVRGYDTVHEGDYVVLTVSDTGTGISSEDMNKMFEPFYTKKKMGRNGTGLGLAIVWGTVKDHEGYIDVQSIEGKGTTFTLFFPVTREKMGEDAQKIPIEQYMGHGKSVLVVDDVQEQRQVATTLLMRLGYQVNAVSSGEEAVEYLKSNRVDILVLDMIMEPGIDGLETYERVLEINPKQKAIIVSGFSETERIRKAQELGAGAYVKKPYLMEKIGVAIRDELTR